MDGSSKPSQYDDIKQDTSTAHIIKISKYLFILLSWVITIFYKNDYPSFLSIIAS